MIGLLITTLESDDDKDFMLDLYKNYYSLVRKTIYNITHDNKDIEDLINDIFIKLIEKISLIRTLGCYKLTTYIVYTARSITANYIKHKKVENKHIYYGDDTDIAEDISNYEDGSEVKLIHQ